MGIRLEWSVWLKTQIQIMNARTPSNGAIDSVMVMICTKKFAKGGLVHLRIDAEWISAEVPPDSE